MDTMADLEDWWQNNFDTDNCWCNALLPDGTKMFPHGCKAENHLMKDGDNDFDDIRKEFESWLNEQEEVFNKIPKNQPIKAFENEGTGGLIYTQRQIFFEALLNLPEKMSVSDVMHERMTPF